MSSVRAAAKLAQRGPEVFRLKSGTKKHFIDKNWAVGGAIHDPLAVFDAFSGGQYNIGWLMDGHLALDFDAHKGGLDALAEWKDRLPPTYTQATPNGGLHYVYKLPEGLEVANSVEKIARGVDVRGRGGYLVGAGSTFDGKPYSVVNDLPIAAAPQWLIDLVQHVSDKDTNAAQVVGELDTVAAIESARVWLESSAPIAVEGEGGDNTTYRVACMVLDRGVSPETALDLMLEHWNERCEPPWEPADLEAKVDSAARNRQSAIGRDNPAAGFEPAVLPPPEPLKPATSSLLEYGRDVSLGEIIAHQANAIVKGLIGPRESGTIYGTSGEGKSFVAIDLAFHVAHGLPYLGRKVKRTPVLYVALEGVPGFRKRMLAAITQFGDAGDYFARLNVPHVSLAKNDDGAAGAKLIAEQALLLKERVGADTCLIIIDTKARATAGDDENSASDMSLYAERRVGYLIQHTNAFVLTVHHAGKTGTFRGSTAQVGAEDLVIRVEGGQAHAEKVKDDTRGALFDFKLKQVTLGKDDEDVPVTTCIVQKSAPTKEVPREKLPAKSKGRDRDVDVLREAMSLAGASVAGVRVPLRKVREIFRERYGESIDASNKAFSRGRNKLYRSRAMAWEGTEIWYEAADFAAH